MSRSDSNLGEIAVSLMKTLAKVAIGVAVAKGAKSLMNRSSSGAGSAGQGGLGGLLGGLVQNAGGSQPHAGAKGAGGGLEDMLGGLLGGTKGGGGGLSGGLGGMLEKLGGAGGTGGTGGGLGGLLGGLAGAAGPAKGGGGLLDGADETLRRAPESNDHSFGDVLNSQFDETPEPVIEPTRDQEAAAALMLAAMIQAAKSDGKLDDSERQKLLDKLGDADAAEAAFVKRQMAAPVDVDALISQTPKGLEAQVYAMSLLGIDLDTQDEAQYLHKLAQGYGMTPEAVNQIHEQMGIPSLYT